MEARELAERWIGAIPAKDFEGIARLLAPDARLRALVPPGFRDDDGRDAVLARMRLWWNGDDALELVESELDELGGRTRFRYRLRGRDPELGWVVSEQTGFLDADGGRIVAIDLVCSGDRPTPTPDGA